MRAPASAVELQAVSEGRPTLHSVNVADLAPLPVPVRDWLVPELIPASVPTIVSGDGDAGKTLLLLQLAAASAARQQWLGRDVAGGRTIFFSAEDDLAELHRRVADIARAMGVSLADLDEMCLVPLVEEPDTILAAPEGRGDILKPTPLWARVVALIADWQPVLAVFDPRADLFGGNEISRPQARQFIGMFRRLGVNHGTTVVLADHPSLAGMSSGSGQSGSTGWRNSARSMLYLQRVTVKTDKLEAEPDADRRILTNKKANYSRRGVEIPIRWLNGAFVLDDGTAAEIAAAPQNALADLVFLELVDRYSGEGRYVSATPSPNYAPAIFSKDATAKGISRDALVGSMNRLFNAGRLRVEEYGPPSRRLKRLVAVPEAA